MKKKPKQRRGIYKDVKPEPISMQNPEGVAAFKEAAKKEIARLAAPVEAITAQLRESLVEWLKQSGCRISDNAEETQQLGQPGEGCSRIGDGRVVILPRDDYEPADEVEAARVKQWRDAAEVLKDLFMIDHQCTLEPVKLEYIFRAAFNAGRRYERLGIRPFERLVGIGIEQVEKGEKLKSGRKQTAAEDRVEKRREAEEAIDGARRDFPSRRDEKTFIVKKAAEKLGVTTRTIERRLQKSSDTT